MQPRLNRLFAADQVPEEAAATHRVFTAALESERAAAVLEI